MRKSRLLINRLGVLIAALAISALVLFMINEAFDLDLGYRLYVLRQRLFGAPMEGLGQRDDRLGWRPKPNHQGTVEKPDFTATYTFGPDGYRVVAGGPSSGKVVAMMGGSFTIGTGVNDDETYPSVLQREYWKAYRVRNLGVYAYGTSHVLLQLEEEFEAGHQIDVVVYGWIAHHLFRNYRRHRWLMSLTSWGGEGPLFEVVDGKPVYQGLIDLDEAMDDNDPRLIVKEWEVTEALLAAIAETCKAHGARFIVVLLPWEISIGSTNTNRRLAAVCRLLGVECLDLTGEMALTGKENYYRHDHHPIPSWHKAVARLIAQGIDVEPGKVTPTTRPR